MNSKSPTIAFWIVKCTPFSDSLSRNNCRLDSGCKGPVINYRLRRGGGAGGGGRRILGGITENFGRIQRGHEIKSRQNGLS